MDGAWYQFALPSPHSSVLVCSASPKYRTLYYLGLGLFWLLPTLTPNLTAEELRLNLLPNDPENLLFGLQVSRTLGDDPKQNDLELTKLRVPNPVLLQARAYKIYYYDYNTYKYIFTYKLYAI